jgi:dienelactone hydrolase
MVIVGSLRLPRDAAGRVPAMVIAHGSGRVGTREAAWADRLGALRLLAPHPRIDPDRVRIIGFSDGGQVALYTALEPTRIDGLRAVCYGCRANRFSHSSRTMWSGRWQ